MCTFKYIHIKIKENKEIRSTKKVQVIIVNTKKSFIICGLLSLWCFLFCMKSAIPIHIFATVTWITVTYPKFWGLFSNAENVSDWKLGMPVSDGIN